MTVFQLDGNSTSIGSKKFAFNSLTSQTLDDHFMQTDFIISLVRDEDSRQRVLQTAQNLNVPTIQSQLYPWDGSYKSKLL